MTQDPKNIDDVLRQALPSALTEEMEAARQRIFATLRSDDGAPVSHPLGDFHFTPSPGWRRAAVWGAVAALLAAAVWTGAVFQQNRSIYAVLKTPDGTAYRGAAQHGGAIRIGERIHAGETVRTNESGGVIELADGSIVEMRHRSELRLERAQDGVRIRLNEGSVIVNAAKQPQGHLYVQTKDVTVSVVGTVFLVNAEEEGSRVAVIEGEVRVRQGTTEEKLLPGEQLATNSLMESLSVKGELFWSRDAETLLALLQQSAFASFASTASQKPTEFREAFEEVAVRPSGLTAGGGQRGAGGGNVSSRLGYGSPCLWSRRDLQIDPRRFSARDTPTYQLIVWAYPIGDCDAVNTSGLLVGGPEWVRLDGFDIEAVMPEGTPRYTPDQLRSGDALKLQRMLQTLLAERFKLTLRRETREMPVYLLTGTGKLKTSIFTPNKEMTLGIMRSAGEDFRGGAVSLVPTANGQYASSITGTKVFMTDLALRLAELLNRPVLDRTDLKGEFNLRLEFAPTDATRSFFGDARPFMTSPSVFTAVEEQLGLKLEAAKAPVEVLVIEHVEKPSEN